MVALKKLAVEAQSEAYEFCASRPEQAAFVAGWIHEGGLAGKSNVPRAWLLAEHHGRRISGLLYVSGSGILIPLLDPATAAEQVGEFARANPSLVRVLVGERALVAAIWVRLQRQGLTARLARDQLGYMVEQPAFRPVVGPLALTIAGMLHLEQVVAASAAMAREEAQDDPQARNPELFRARISERLARGRDFVHLEAGQLAFKCNVSALSPAAAQVEGIYTLPGQRRRGLGSRGTAAVTEWALARARRAVLLVNEDNEPAQRIYERLGYRRQMESRTIFIAP